MGWSPLSFFFFQAEDGIRDADVTGVQTCALPICLLLLLVSPAWARPGRSLADGSTSSDNQIGDTAPGNEEDAALLNETLPLDAVLTYAHAHNSTIHAARNRVRAAQKVPPQASACDDPMVMWDNWDTPENLHLNEASNNIFRLSQRHCQ